MFARVEFMAESGSHPDDLGSYAFWIPVLGVLVVFGIASGLPFGFAVVNAKLYPARPAMPDFAKVKAADFVDTSFAEQASAGRPKHD